MATRWYQPAFEKLSLSYLFPPRQDTKGCYHTLQTISKMLGLPIKARDTFAEFLSPLSPLYLQRGLNLSSRPSFPSLKSLKEVVTDKVSRGGVKWCRSNREVGGATRGGQMSSPEISYTIKTEWMYAVLKASELGRQVRVGVCAVLKVH